MGAWDNPLRSRQNPLLPRYRRAQTRWSPARPGGGGCSRCYPDALMGENKEVRFERLYVKVPGTDRLRKTAEGRLRHLLNDGWREIERSQTSDYVEVHLERAGHVP